MERYHTAEINSLGDKDNATPVQASNERLKLKIGAAALVGETHQVLEDVSEFVLVNGWLHANCVQHYAKKMNVCSWANFLVSLVLILTPRLRDVSSGAQSVRIAAVKSESKMQTISLANGAIPSLPQTRSRIGCAGVRRDRELMHLREARTEAACRYKRLRGDGNQKSS